MIHPPTLAMPALAITVLLNGCQARETCHAYGTEALQSVQQVSQGALVLLDVAGVVLQIIQPFCGH